MTLRSLASLNYHERHRHAEARLLLEKALEIEQELATSFPAVGEYVFYLIKILRDCRDWFGDTDRLHAVRDHFTVKIEEHQSRFPPENRDNALLWRYYLYRAVIHELLGRYSEALSDSKLAGYSESGILARLQAQRGDYGRAEATATTVPQRDPGLGQEFYLAAQVGAYLASVVRKDRSLAAARREELGEKYSRQAVQWLQKSQSLKYRSAPSTRFLLADDRDLEPLRSRDDFQALVARSNRAPGTEK